METKHIDSNAENKYIVKTIRERQVTNKDGINKQ
jgi:hypothetical protein